MSAVPFLAPVVLEGRHVRLEPMEATHAQELAQAVRDGELWKLWYTSVPRPEAIDEHVTLMLKRREQRTFLPFVVRLRETGEVVGQTTFCNVDHDNRRVEIGYTWYSQRVQRTAVNTEAKYLLLGHAFDAWQCIAVEFRTNWFNERSRAAIARLGAKQDGVLRNHQRLPDGSFRDTVVFSIIQSEWSAVKNNLDYRLGIAGSQRGDGGRG
ncbi:RimJ/RimL family protein N-acetyltransferase [Lysobacter niastensis]|uniref:RimJ/RimL family protein N-acetyltransferase n=1 Tax=Lysobacter niastensis TaxID=380629 RepID=A0ABU1WF03_9GAMM|nr:GNAT family protein [Lysobacter niastensis]MDR7136183.1 RimJ/RimL family protein N-acetyltransferase [Lysobacter niastensis]